jgi:hypothetical protein
MFNKEQILGFVRHALTLLGGGIVTNGMFTESEMLEAVGALITVIGFAWSYIDKRNHPAIEEEG